MPFRADMRQWVSVADFAAHLQAYAPSIAPWAQGAIVHHTYRPVQSAWSGLSTMRGMKSYYESLGWDAGPHLFIVAGSPNVAHDGIWQMTPLNEVGVHAGVCNSRYWGIEVVGDYDDAPWDAATRQLVVGAIGELLKWRSIAVSATSIKGHRDCNSPKTCPGTSINLTDVRSWVSTYMAPPPPVPPTPPPPVPPTPPPPVTPITQDTAWVAAPRCTLDQAIRYLQSTKQTSVYTTADVHMHIVPAYWDACVAVDLDPCVVLAHMLFASDRLRSWWAQPGRYNLAEVGVIPSESRSITPVPDDAHNWTWYADTKRWKKGLSFATLQDGVRAHVGRIVAYANAPDQRTAAQQTMVTQALLVRSLPPAFHGVAPMLVGLDHRWKYPGPRYGERVALLAEAMRTTVVS